MWTWVAVLEGPTSGFRGAPPINEATPATVVRPREFHRPEYDTNPFVQTMRRWPSVFQYTVALVLYEKNPVPLRKNEALRIVWSVSHGAITWNPCVVSVETSRSLLEPGGKPSRSLCSSSGETASPRELSIIFRSFSFRGGQAEAQPLPAVAFCSRGGNGTAGCSDSMHPPRKKATIIDRADIGRVRARCGILRGRT
jgi:hypothetical protein